MLSNPFGVHRGLAESGQARGVVKIRNRRTIVKISPSFPFPMKSEPTEIVKSRRPTTSVIYWEVEKGAYRARVFVSFSRNFLSPFLLILNVKTRHPTGDILAPKILFEMARRRCLSVAGRYRVKSRQIRRARARARYSVDNLDVNCRNVDDVTRNSRCTWS